MTEEELELVAALRKQRKLDYNREYHAEHADERNAKKRADREARNAPRIAAEEERRLAVLAQDTLAANALAGSYRHVAYQQDRDRINETAARTRNKAKAERRFTCSPCDKVFATDFALDKHLGSQEHQDKLDGVQRQRTQYADNTKAARAANVASGKYHCPLCNKNFPNDWSLTRHKKESKKHIQHEEAAALL